MKTKAWAGGKALCGSEVLKTYVGKVKALSFGDKNIKACVGLRGVCGLEVWKAQVDKTRFAVRRIKACMGLEGLCGPDESNSSSGEREPLCVYISTYIYIYIYIYICIFKKKLTLYMIFLFRPTQPRYLEPSTKHQ